MKAASKTPPPKPSAHEINMRLAWAAGIIDGEGSIVVSRSGVGKFQLQVQVIATSQAMIECICAIAGDGHVYSYPGHQPRSRSTWRWTIRNHRAAAFLVRVLPFLVVKVEQATLGIDFASGMAHHGGGTGRHLEAPEVNRRADIYARMKELNRRGVVEPKSYRPLTDLRSSLKRNSR